MDALWDSDTGIVTVTATVNGTAVNLSATTEQHLKVRNVASGVVTELTGGTNDLANGIVRGVATALGPGKYTAILRVVDPTSGTVTYPSADVGPPHFVVKADMDA